MSYEYIIVERDNNVGVITLNRPEVLNALNRALYKELDTAVGEMEADPEIKAVIVTGMGERAFSAGADIHEQVRICRRPKSSTPRTGSAPVLVAHCGVHEANNRRHQRPGFWRRGSAGE